MRFLLDTNIIIAAEPTAALDLELGAPVVAEFVKLAHAGGHQLQIHPATISEIAGDKDLSRRQVRVALTGKYPTLPNPPATDPSLANQLGLAELGEHTAIDLTILSALKADCADYFVTDDQRLAKRARRLGLSERVVSASDAVDVLRALFPTVPKAPPLVYPCYAHELDAHHQIFDSLRTSYPNFDGWLAKCKREQRQCWIVKQSGDIAALAIVNEEQRQTYGLTGRVLKLCTFKVAPNHRGFRFGELLLKALFDFAFSNGFSAMFVETFEKQAELLELLDAFGFDEIARKSDEEVVVAKRLVPAQDCKSLGAIEYHRRYGPKHLCVDSEPSFVVPVQPHYHDLLFPVLEAQLSLIEESNPFGNGIRKAYLSHASTRKIRPGSVLLFYRSSDARSVAVVGVAEGTLVSTDADEIARFVGRRTVYAHSTIRGMARRDVLAVTFRLARTFPDPWPLHLLRSSGILNGPPQSITQVSPKGIQWIGQRLTESP